MTTPPSGDPGATFAGQASTVNEALPVHADTPSSRIMAAMISSHVDGPTIQGFARTLTVDR